MAKLRKHMCLMCKVERSMSLISGMHDDAYTVIELDISKPHVIHANEPAIAYAE